MITSSDWRRAVWSALEDPSDWAFRGKLTYRVPVDWMLVGVHAEGSGFQRDRVYISSLWVPLFVPRTVLDLSHSKRVPTGSSTHGLDEPVKFELAIRQALAQVPAHDTALGLIAASSSEESAYASLLLGNKEDAERALAAPFSPGDDRPFVQAARARREEIRSHLSKDDLEAAIRVLGQWRDSTMRSLGLAPAR